MKWARTGRLLYPVGNIPVGATVRILAHGGDQKLVKYINENGEERQFNVHNNAIEELFDCKQWPCPHIGFVNSTPVCGLFLVGGDTKIIRNGRINEPCPLNNIKNKGDWMNKVMKIIMWAAIGLLTAGIAIIGILVFTSSKGE